MRFLCLLLFACSPTRETATDLGYKRAPAEVTVETAELDRWRHFPDGGAAEAKHRPRSATFVGSDLRIDWYSSHPCGKKPTPRVEVDGIEVRLLLSFTGAERVDCDDEIIAFRTVIKNFTAAQVHVAGPHGLSLTASRTMAP
jgi:hypothetical protein